MSARFRAWRLERARLALADIEHEDRAWDWPRARAARARRKARLRARIERLAPAAPSTPEED